MPRPRSASPSRAQTDQAAAATIGGTSSPAAPGILPPPSQHDGRQPDQGERGPAAGQEGQRSPEAPAFQLNRNHVPDPVDGCHEGQAEIRASPVPADRSIIATEPDQQSMVRMAARIGVAITVG